MTESAVTFMSRPLSNAELNKDLHGLSSWIPIMHPFPRMSDTLVAFFSLNSRPCIIDLPIISARSERFSLQIYSTEAKAAAHESGLPPNVDP